MVLFQGMSFFYPIIATFLLLIISSVPTYIAGASAFFPIFDIMAIFYWSSQRPSALPNWFVFTLGICRDLVEGLTLGTNPCIYLITKFIVKANRGMYRKVNFIVILQSFAIVALLTTLAKWLLVSFIIGLPLPPDNALMQVMLSVAVYPLIHWLFNLVSSLMPDKFHDN